MQINDSKQHLTCPPVCRCTPSPYNKIIMKSSATNRFRFRHSKPRQTYFEPESREGNSQTQQGSAQRKGFSSEYMNLAKRFHIKILHDRSLSPLVNLSRQRQCSPKVQPFRVKTDFSRNNNHRYKWQPAIVLPGKPQSLSMHYKTPAISNRSSKPLFRHNQNTVYNQTFVRLPTEKDEIVAQPETIVMQVQQHDNVLMHLGNHSRKLLAIKESLEREETNQKEIIKQIKQYILREEGSSIAHLEQSFPNEQLRKEIKKLILLERMALISIISNILTGHIFEHLEQSIRTIEIVLGFWHQVISNTYQSHLYKLEIQMQSDIKTIITKLEGAKLMTKANLKLLLDTVLLKISLLFKHNHHFYNKIAFLVAMSEQLSINRSFYELLTHFARYLTDLQKKMKVNIDAVSFFATCPSPYLLKPARKQYSLVVDLDQTLIYSHMINNKLETTYRPHCFPFIEQLSQFYEIIIFTTSLQSYAREVTLGFKNVDHFLFRQHAVRIKNGFVKDLNRLGRDLNKVVIIDDRPNNFKLQKQNGIHIKAWNGDQKDEELQRLKTALISIAGRNSKDIKQQLPIVRQQMKQSEALLKLVKVQSPQ